MELKLLTKAQGIAAARSSNRTFMELKLARFENENKSRWF